MTYSEYNKRLIHIDSQSEAVKAKLSKRVHDKGFWEFSKRLLESSSEPTRIVASKE